MIVVNTLPTMMASQQLIEEAEQDKYNTCEKSRTDEIEYDKYPSKNEKKEIKRYKFGCCCCCGRNDLAYTSDHKKIVCKFCNSWTWLEDAYYSCWLEELEGENNG